MRRSEPQISPALFKPLLDLDKIKRGTKVYKTNDQKEVHWQHTVYTIDRAVKGGMLLKDTHGKPVLVPDDELDNLFVYEGHVDTREHISLQ